MRIFCPTILTSPVLFSRQSASGPSVAGRQPGVHLRPAAGPVDYQASCPAEHYHRAAHVHDVRGAARAGHRRHADGGAYTAARTGEERRSGWSGINVGWWEPTDDALGL